MKMMATEGYNSDQRAMYEDYHRTRKQGETMTTRAIRDDDDGLEMSDNSCGECGHPYKAGDETHYPECSRIQVDGTTTQPEPATSERDFPVLAVIPELNWKILDTLQGPCFEFPDSRHDWPTPREKQIIEAFQNTAVNHHYALVSALENILADCQTAAEKRTTADWDFAMTQAIEYASAALATIRQPAAVR